MIFDINSRDFIWNYENLNRVTRFFCKYVVWIDDMQLCYVNNHIYNNCDKCPFNYNINKLECVNYEL